MSSSRYRLSAAVVCMAIIGAGQGFAAPPVGASGLRMTVETPHFTCERSGVSLSHAALGADGIAGRKPLLPCCNGQIGCAQFLSTSTVLHAARRWRS